MAQIVKLKRTSVSGKVPTISNVELGELAMNTYDGRIFFEKSSSVESIQEILTTNAGKPITGSINLNGAITASYFKGDGSQLTNVSTDIGEVSTVTSSFDNSSTIDVGHNFSTKNVIVSVYDSNDNQIIPQTVTLTDTDNVRVVLSAAQSGFVVVAKGGHVVSGSADDSNKLNGQLASYYLNYNNFTNVPSGLVSGSTFSSPSQGTVRATINGSNTDVDTGLQTGDSPQFTNLTLTGNLTVQGTTTTIDSTTVNIGDNILELNYGGSATTSGILTKDATGGSTTSGSLLWDATNDYWKVGKSGSESEVITTSNIVTNLPTGTISGSSQLTTEFDTRYLNTNGDGVISGSAQVVSSLSNQDLDLGTGNITATTGSFDVIDLDRLSLTSTQTTVPPLQLTANSLQDGVGALRIDGSQADIFLNPSTATHTTVTFAVNNDQRLAFGMDNNSDFYITRRTGGTWYDDTFVLDRDTGEVTLGYDLTVNGNINATNGIVSGSSQITDLTTHKETVSGASSYAVTHNLNESYPIVQAWNTSTSQQEVPQSITTNSANQVTVVFSTTFAGVIIVKK